ncbi:hypothetical protein [Pseudorhizobium marinum]|jgi:hypothetical protein|uniref:Uncharacterized protein n=2 Tax=Pseudorhizobium pelagicum TaxID=1509405 RepID=A0A922P172_9HYPH|nr:hypothetical protein [Pseudorhizobium marinum]KEQ08877.1 hypothetical protein GV67_10180 [Pseudorhizobium pelagicum]MBU1315062.1 hypothetical protein [Alphaproteobacteria bacterium]KEQ09867.1 hypothetical protein GV68_21200 [Pseudorhizobium pelagicum]MBU1550393.1 hypothetical protein [Alphaproteobacteria bacterium]MBU2338529.1 hypothetical protein [Alphaproteobacteria bacterium]
MIASDSMPVPRKSLPDGGSERGRLMDTPEFVEKLAKELRQRSDPHLPHEFYLEQVRRQLAGRAGLSGTAARDAVLGSRKTPLQSASVFRAWAMPE